ncbi:MAG TPA: DUF350 domain-containing protein [Minicystis sp.]|nr:DUF350 domain-containing protein [Minicystis sp.]
MVSVHLGLVLVGLGKIVFGVFVGVLGIFLASRALARLLACGRVDDAVREGNVAIGILNAAGVVSLGILAERAVGSTFEAMDLLYRGRGVDGSLAGRFAAYAVAHVGLALVVGSIVLALGAWVFGRLTRDVDELAEVRKNNVAAAVVLGGVLVVLALVTAPGLSTALDGLLPLPALAADEGLAPS